MTHAELVPCVANTLYRNIIRSVIRVHLSGAGDIDDVYQEVQVRAVEECSTLENSKHYLNFCCDVAWKLCVDRLRSANVVVKYSGAAQKQILKALDTLTSSRLYESRLAALRECLDQMTPEDRGLLKADISPPPEMSKFAKSRRKRVLLTRLRRCIDTRLATE